MKRVPFALLFIVLSWACTTRGYVNYLVDPDVNVPPALTESSESAKALPSQPTEKIKVAINNGESLTEIEVPVSSSGQIVLVEPGSKKSARAGDKGPSVQPPVPNSDDAVHRSLHQAYVQKGLKENTEAPPVSLSQSRSRMEQAIRLGKYTEALAYAEMALNRYPSQVSFLRAKGSILLLLGEKEEAIRVYEKAQEIDFSASVAKKIAELSQN